MAGFWFNDLLAEAGISVEHTRLVRHQDSRGTTPYRLWLAQDRSLERYQQIQSRRPFDIGDWLASFVATPWAETLFVGMYRVTGLGRVLAGEIDPVGGHAVGGLNDYRIEPCAELKEHAGRLVIEWGSGYRTWVQRARNQNKSVIELRRSSAIDSQFPGFARFRHSIRELDSVPQRWRDALAAVNGVYLLASTSTGKLYVGSAYGSQGFWGRWEDYFRTGHGGNVGLLPIRDEDMQVSILEVASSTASEKEILELEALWKDRMLSRQFGLNRN